MSQLALLKRKATADSNAFLTAGPGQSLARSATPAITVAGGAKVMSMRIRTARVVDPATSVIACRIGARQLARHIECGRMLMHFSLSVKDSRPGNWRGRSRNRLRQRFRLDRSGDRLRLRLGSLSGTNAALRQRLHGRHHGRVRCRTLGKNRRTFDRIARRLRCCCRSRRRKCGRIRLKSLPSTVLLDREQNAEQAPLEVDRQTQ